MLREKLNALIKDATLSKDARLLEVIRSIKTAFTNFEKTGKELTDNDEVAILLKMVSQRKDSIEQYTKGGRQDLVDIEREELELLMMFVPEQPSEQEVSELAQSIIDQFVEENGRSVEMRDMGFVLSTVRLKYPTADGKTVSDVLRRNIGKKDK